MTVIMIMQPALGTPNYLGDVTEAAGGLSLNESRIIGQITELIEIAGSADVSPTGIANMLAIQSEGVGSGVDRNDFYAALGNRAEITQSAQVAGGIVDLLGQILEAAGSQDQRSGALGAFSEIVEAIGGKDEYFGVEVGAQVATLTEISGVAAASSSLAQMLGFKDEPITSGDVIVALAAMMAQNIELSRATDQSFGITFDFGLKIESVLSLAQQQAYSGLRDSLSVGVGALVIQQGIVEKAITRTEAARMLDLVSGRLSAVGMVTEVVRVLDLPTSPGAISTAILKIRAIAATVAKISVIPPHH